MTAFKAGDSQVRRGGRSTGLGVGFDVYWLSPGEMERRLIDARLCDRVLGRAPRRGAGGLPAGISARSEVLKPTDPALANTLNLTRSSAGHLCTRNGRSGRSPSRIVVYEYQHHRDINSAGS